MNAREGMRIVASMILAMATVVALACRSDHGGSKPPSASRDFPVDRLGRFYQANAQIEMDQEPAAGKILDPLLTSVGREPAILANLAIVRLAAAQNEASLALAHEAFSAAPESADIALILAAAQRANGQYNDAQALLKGAIEANDNDVRLRWAYIQGLETQENPSAPSDALTNYEAILRVAPTNLAALLGAARTAAASDQIQRADALLRRALAQIPEPPESLAPYLDDLDDVVKNGNVAKLSSIVTRTRNLMLATDRYKADVIALGASADQTPAPVRHPIWPLKGDPRKAMTAEIHFERLPAESALPRPADAPPIVKVVVGAVADDRSTALFAIDNAGKGRLFVLDGKGWKDATMEAGLANAPACRNATFLDLNNDRRIDLLLSCESGDRYFSRNAAGRFEDVSQRVGLTERDASNGARAFDYDNDGDLDLLRWDDARLYLHQNDGEGALTAIAARPGLPMETPGIESIRTLDLDDDGDVDLFITTGTGPYSIHVISNERLACFRDVTSLLEQLQKSCLAPPAIADFDNDGWLETLDVTLGSRTAFGPEFQTRTLSRMTAPNHPSAVAIADFDNDGSLDTVFVHGGGGSDREDVTVTPGSTLQAVDLDNDGLVDLISSAGEIFMNRTKGAGAWLRVALVGLNTGDSRFNALGIGSAIEIRCGENYQKRHVESPTTHFGLGPCQQADVMRVVWPNGNYQSLEYRTNSRTALTADRTIVEEQTLKGSCPYLYAWNGERFEFVTDVLWRSALGMSIMQGVYGHHGTADDYFKIAGDQMAPDDGFYRLSFTEELWETSYLDLCRLLVVDHPVGTEIHVDEKCLMPPYPPFEIFKVERRRYPVSATDERGRDVRPQLIARDHRYVDGFTPTRYQGIVEPHELVMDLGEFDADAPVRLFLQGWLWPTDASTNVAVSQNPNVHPQSPTIQVVAEDGSWRETGRIVGFPSGKSKTITIDLTGAFPTADHRVRLSTNFCIYWDHIFCSVGDQEVETRVTELGVKRAELRERGISEQYRRWPGGPRIPDYDVLDPAAQWRDLVGGYTALGDVSDLVSILDDRYAIVGAGDEVEIWFDANAAPDLPGGWTRDFIVHTDGWLKDGDLNSATGKTVEPLPWREMTAFPPNEKAPERDEASVRNSRYRDQEAFRKALRR